jgi:polyhydroxyalkanoate synthesis regulator phasin
MADYIPLIIAALSLVGSAAASIYSFQERKAKQALDEASAAKTLGESYQGLVQTLEGRVDDLEEDLAREKGLRAEVERRAMVLANKIGTLELQLDQERQARLVAEQRVEALSERVAALEKENRELKQENAILRAELLDN